MLFANCVWSTGSDSFFFSFGVRGGIGSVSIADLYIQDHEISMMPEGKSFTIDPYLASLIFHSFSSCFVVFNWNTIKKSNTTQRESWACAGTCRNRINNSPPYKKNVHKKKGNFNLRLARPTVAMVAMTWFGFCMRYNTVDVVCCRLLSRYSL